jgi:hypothetical protein
VLVKRCESPPEEMSQYMSEVQGEYDDRFSALRDLLQGAQACQQLPAGLTEHRPQRGVAAFPAPEM